MIIVKNRELLIPENERYIGTTYDDTSENRQFRVPRFAQNGVDLSGLTFRLDLKYANNGADTVVLSKVIEDDNIILTWSIAKSVLQVPGTLYIGIRATDGSANVRWATFTAALYVERHLNTPGTYTGDLTEIEQMEQDHEYMKGVVDELKRNLDYAHDAEAWAQGTRSGTAVPSTDKTYHKNSKYYADQASTKATQAANSATDAANSATQAAETVEDTNTRFNNAMAAVTSDTEVIDARVGADGIQYTVLKNRLDAEHNQLKKETDNLSDGKQSISGKFSYGIFNSSNMPETDPRKFNAVMMTAEKYDRDITITAKNGYNFITYFYDANDNYVDKSSKWEASRYVRKDTYFRLWVRQNPLDTSVVLDLDTVKQQILFNARIQDEIALAKDNAGLSGEGLQTINTSFTYGMMNTSTGQAVIDANRKYQVIMPHYITYDTDVTIKCNGGYRYQVWWYNEDDTYISRTASFKTDADEYTVTAGTHFRLMVTLNPPDISANVPVETFAKNIFIRTKINDRIAAVETKPLSTLPEYVLNTLSYRPVGALSKGYILLSCDDGTAGLATYTIPMLINKNVPATFGLLMTSPVITNSNYLATVIDAVSNHGCCVAQHGSAQWTTYAEYALNKYFDETKTVFNSAGIAEIYGAICPGGSVADTNALVQAVAGGRFGSVFSGGMQGELKYGNYNAVGARTNIYAMARYSAIGFSAATYQAAIDEAYENHYILCPFWHDYSVVDDTARQAIIEGMIDYAKSKGLTFITMKDLPSIT